MRRLPWPSGARGACTEATRTPRREPHRPLSTAHAIRYMLYDCGVMLAWKREIRKSMSSSMYKTLWGHHLLSLACWAIALSRRNCALMVCWSVRPSVLVRQSPNEIGDTRRPRSSTRWQSQVHREGGMMRPGMRRYPRSQATASR